MCTRYLHQESFIQVGGPFLFAASRIGTITVTGRQILHHSQSPEKRTKSLELVDAPSTVLRSISASYRELIFTADQIPRRN